MRKAKKVVDRRRDETVGDFLARGGSITKCPPRNVDKGHKGMLTIDGETLVLNIGGYEYVPQNVLDVKNWDAATEKQPDNILPGLVLEHDIACLPVNIRNVATRVSPPQEEWSGSELSDYYDELEPEDSDNE